jgi:hypothetical protein
MDLPPFQNKKRPGEIFLPACILRKPQKTFSGFYMGDCGSSSAGKGRPALPDQPEEREEDPLPMPNRI